MTSADVAAQPRLTAVLRLASFRNLWIAGTFSLLGDGFSFVAFAWITFAVTGSSSALGGVLAVQAAFRALLSMIGGVMADRMSPRLMMLLSSCVRTLVMFTVAGLGLTGLLSLWMLFVLGGVFGAVDAFFLPARATILPSVVDKDLLESANGLLSSGGRIASVVGPPLGGVVVAVSNANFGFIVDGVCFALCATFVSLVTTTGAPSGQRSSRKRPAESMINQIRAGVAYTLADARLRAVIAVDTAVTFCYAGPFTVGFASLARFRLAGGATTLGAMSGALTGGAIIGAIAGGLTPSRPRLGLLMAGLTGWLAIGMVLLGVQGNVLAAVAVTFGMGLAIGFQGVFGTSWAQRNIDREVLGRVIALDMTAGYLLSPVSLIIVGFLVRAHPEAVFLLTGALLALIGVAILYSRPVRTMR